MKINISSKTLVPEKIPDSPLFVAEIKDSAFELQGWLVIHSFGPRGSCGGIRLYPDVSQQEVELLAKAMTYKYCFYEADLGGAKATVRLPFNIGLADRVMILRKFGEHIAPLIKSRVYWPWTDMNCSSVDIINLYQGAGVKIHALPGNSAYFTALSTFAAVQAWAEYYQVPAEQCLITIEGLGNVGKYLAIEIDRWGAKLIGASTRIGAVANLNGLDVKQILKSLEKANDFWVEENGNWQIMSKERLFSLPMNIHIPCARTYSLTEKVAEDLNCSVVIPAANVPCSPNGEMKLNEKGIKLLPDFLVNSGGVIGPGLSHLQSSDSRIRNLFSQDFKEMIKRLLKLSDRSQTTPTVLANLESHKYFRTLWMSGREKASSKKSIIRALASQIHIPKKLTSKNKESKIRRILRERFT
jgi:glutamate dehydrogenase/leucine dehydrogenase